MSVSVTWMSMPKTFVFDSVTSLTWKNASWQPVLSLILWRLHPIQGACGELNSQCPQCHTHPKAMFEVAVCIIRFAITLWVHSTQKHRWTIWSQEGKHLANIPWKQTFKDKQYRYVTYSIFLCQQGHGSMSWSSEKRSDIAIRPPLIWNSGAATATHHKQTNNPSIFFSFVKIFAEVPVPGGHSSFPLRNAIIYQFPSIKLTLYHTKYS